MDSRYLTQAMYGTIRCTRGDGVVTIYDAATVWSTYCICAEVLEILDIGAPQRANLGLNGPE